jgi:phospholipid-binding lipoprotein MlaA
MTSSKDSQCGTWHSVVLFLACLMLFSACSTTKRAKDYYSNDVLHPVNEVLKEDVIYPVDVYDPWEGFNRRSYTFNYYFDKYLFLPIVDTYEFLTPEILQDAISNIFSNLSDIRNLLNSALQLKGDQTAKTGGRFLLNTTLGLAGIWDPATQMGLYQQNEDFGQTLGYYGVGEGPYLMLPVFGPSNVRDGLGFLADTAMYYPIDPLNLATDRDYEALITGVKAIDTRHNVSFRYFETGSPFEYEMLRFLYLKKRQLDIGK